MPFLRTAWLALACSGLISGACKSAPGGDADAVTIATFGSVEHIAKMNAQLAKLTEREGIRTKAVYVPFANYTDKIVLQLSDGKAPDVIWCEVGFYVALQAHGALRPLDPYIKRDKLDLRAYYPGVMKRFTNDKGIFALPQDTAPIACLFYNKALFRQAGVAFPSAQWSWNDLLKAAQKLTSPGVPSPEKVWGFKDNYAPDWANFIYANGGTLVDDWRKPTRCTLDSPQAVEAVTFLRDLMLKHQVMPTDAARQSIGGAGEDMFMQGTLAMLRSGYWPTNKIRTQKNLDWDMAPFPRGPRAAGFAWGTGGSGWAMSRDARDPEKAWRVIRHLASEDVQRAWVEAGDIQPSIVRLARAPAFTGSVPPATKDFLLTAPDKAVYSPAHPKWDAVLINTISPRMDLILLGKVEVKAGLRELTQAVNQELFNR